MRKVHLLLLEERIIICDLYYACDRHIYQPIMPWINGDGNTNNFFYEPLTRGKTPRSAPSCWGWILMLFGCTPSPATTQCGVAIDCGIQNRRLKTLTEKMSRKTKRAPSFSWLLQNVAWRTMAGVQSAQSVGKWEKDFPKWYMQESLLTPTNMVAAQTKCVFDLSV